MTIVLMAGDIHNDVGAGGGGNRDLVTVLVGFVVFALTNAIHLEFMQ